MWRIGYLFRFGINVKDFFRMGTKDTNSMDFGRRIAGLREARGLTQSALARALGLSTSVIGKQEEWRRKMGFK